jgi:hypothetical protein
MDASLVDRKRHVRGTMFWKSTNTFEAWDFNHVKIIGTLLEQHTSNGRRLQSVLQ